MGRPKNCNQAYIVCKQSGSFGKVQLLKKYLIKNKDYASAPFTEWSLFRKNKYHKFDPIGQRGGGTKTEVFIYKSSSSDMFDIEKYIIH